MNLSTTSIDNVGVADVGHVIATDSTTTNVETQHGEHHRVSVWAGRWSTKKTLIMVTIGVVGVMVGSTAVVAAQQVRLRRELASTQRALDEAQADIDAGMAFPTSTYLDDETNQDEVVNDKGNLRKLEAVVDAGFEEKPSNGRKLTSKPNKCSYINRTGCAKTRYKARVNCFASLILAGCSSSSCVMSRNDAFWQPRTSEYGVHCYCGDAGKYDVYP